MMKVGIIGCGSIARFRHAPEYRANPDVNEIVFYDRNPDRAVNLAEEFNGKVVDDIKLKPGFKMLIEIVTSEEKVNTLPINAVQQEDDVNYVFIVEDGKAKRVDVKIGSVDSEKMEIRDGVTKDDKVIINPSEDITNGTEVTVK